MIKLLLAATMAATFMTTGMTGGAFAQGVAEVVIVKQFFGLH